MLLDTHVWVWYASANSALSPKTLALIQQAELERDLYLCPISLWEITLKVSQQTIELDLPVRLWLQRAILSTGIHLTQINIDVACDCAELPADFHGDPGDRLIAATARSQGMTLVTHDHRLLKLAKKGYFKALAA
jgi:PIN domain nuclease of toxin-antitoxin system